MKLTQPQVRYLAKIQAQGTAQFNGRATRTLNILKGHGLITVLDFTFLGPHYPKNDYTEQWTVELTEAGKEALVEHMNLKEGN